MINKYFGMACVFLTILLAACSVEKTNIKEDKTVEDRVIVDSSDNPELAFFELSTKEENVYMDFQKDLNIEHLRGLDPISVAKLYVKAGLDKKFDVQYALYTDRKDYVQWTKEDDEKIPESHRGTVEQAIKQFKNIDTGKFIQRNDYEGYIEYNSGEGKNGFQMIKNEDGIWQVAFLPIQ